MNIADARLEVAIEIASTSLSVSKLRSLARSSLIPVHAVPEGDAEIRIGPNRVAVATLESYEDEVVVTITSLTPPQSIQRP